MKQVRFKGFITPMILACCLFGCARSDAGPTASPGPGYQVIDLNAPAPSIALAINNADEVVGSAQTGELANGNRPIRFENAFLWHDGRVTSIGGLPPNALEDLSASTAFSINTSGVIVGGSGSYGAGPMDGLMFCAAFMYKNGVMSEPMGVAGEAKESEQAFGVNDSGTMVGSEAFHGFVYLNGKQIEVKPLSTLEEGNGSVAVGVNSRNEVVGATATGVTEAHPKIHAFLWRMPGRGSLLDLGTLPGFRNSIAVAINGSEMVVGYATRETSDPAAAGKFIGNRSPNDLDFQGLPINGHAFAWSAGVMHDLGVLRYGQGFSAAFGINESGAVVGTSGNRAVLWRNGVIHDLNAMIPKDSGWTLLQARAINDRGWIAGQGVLHGEKRAFLLTPNTAS